MQIDTPHGRARAHLREGDRGLLVLGHGAGGSIEAPDLQAVAATAHDDGWGVALVEQPYRVAGRRSVPPPPQLDAAWLAVCAALAGHAGPLVVGGRSSGARVACRTARAAGARGVLALAFPLVTPKGVSRQDELDGAGLRTLVIQGERDRFGVPDPGPRRTVVVVGGDHGLKADRDAIAAAARAWLRRTR